MRGGSRVALPSARAERAARRLLSDSRDLDHRTWPLGTHLTGEPSGDFRLRGHARRKIRKLVVS